MSLIYLDNVPWAKRVIVHKKGEGCLLKKLILWVFLLIAFTAAVPLLILSPFSEKQTDIDDIRYGGPEIKVLHSKTKEIMTVPLEKYLVGVVAAEMPAEFPPEALKAQAVAARSYALKKMQDGLNGEGHPGVHVCTDHNHCQAWLSEEEMKKCWGKKAPEYIKKITQAVLGTRGIVLTYENKLIEPVYHSTSSGRTENSEDVWQAKIPYLRSTASPWDKDSPKFRQEISMPLEEVDRKLGTSLSAVPAGTFSQSSPVQILEHTHTGRAKSVEIGGRVFSARELREKLSLPSTDFTCKIKGGEIIFITRGYGHGVGMSQYGAKGMAEEGYTYQEILKHYYTGVSLSRAYR
ncbi:MAG: stage II sporulation protein D [Clostridia bacterium]|nr:stage II sporulation protein D [Clostridia bacterium]